MSGQSSTQEAGLYRYQGVVANNYICFGTTNKNTCKGDPDKYMYRIIGTNSSNQMKLIKKEALNTAYPWNTDMTADVEWPDSDLYATLNGSTFLTNTNYVPSGWGDRIATTTWKYGSLTESSSTVAQIAETETNFVDTVNAKIGLIFIHDYLYAFPEGKNCSSNGYCKPSWLYLNQKGNDLNAPNGTYEWTMTRYDYTLFYNKSWKVNTDSMTIESIRVNELNSVRPVFFLTPSQSIVSGTGTLTDPFILA